VRVAALMSAIELRGAVISARKSEPKKQTPRQGARRGAAGYTGVLPAGPCHDETLQAF